MASLQVSDGGLQWNGGHRRADLEGDGIAPEPAEARCGDAHLACCRRQGVAVTRGDGGDKPVGVLAEEPHRSPGTPMVAPTDDRMQISATAIASPPSETSWSTEANPASASDAVAELLRPDVADQMGRGIRVAVRVTFKTDHPTTRPCRPAVFRLVELLLRERRH